MQISGETLRAWRGINNITQAGMARCLRISQQEYSKWEQKEFLDPERLERFLKSAGCTLEELLKIQQILPPPQSQ